MSIKSDKWIRRMSEQHGMIEPFEPNQIKEMNGQRIKQTSGVRYHDRYVFQDGKWLIAERLSNFMWTDIQPI